MESNLIQKWLWVWCAKIGFGIYVIKRTISLKEEMKN